MYLAEVATCTAKWATKGSASKIKEMLSSAYHHNEFSNKQRFGKPFFSFYKVNASAPQLW